MNRARCNILPSPLPPPGLRRLSVSEISICDLRDRAKRGRSSRACRLAPTVRAVLIGERTLLAALIPPRSRILALIDKRGTFHTKVEPGSPWRLRKHQPPFRRPAGVTRAIFQASRLTDGLNASKPSRSYDRLRRDRFIYGHTLYKASRHRE